MPLCVNCNTAGDPNAGRTQCDACQGTVHLKCIGISESEIKMTRSKSRSIKIVCNQCNNNMLVFKDLKTLISSLRSEMSSAIDNLKADIQTQLDDIKVKLSQAPQQQQAVPTLEEVAQEILERQRRSKNLIIFNLPEEPDTNTRQGSKDKDTLVLNNVFNITNPTNTFTDLNIVRLGRVNESRIRPIKVSFKDESDVLSIIRGAKNLIHDSQFKNIRISFDRTPRQQEVYKQLKAQLNDRLAKGESNLRIRYFNGTPKIVSLN
ncbi:hypothetical protein Zmor_013346 [Zophobas morio]|uniref:Zinc finger PHD-type domain-containing protein n=1 Tax=Zophobas morio TaxID=2755281 RepID=A0AA38IDC2_9CUCU|nr:hypothetical protein Zmor_013346 [Zophobas morio]